MIVVTFELPFHLLTILRYGITAKQTLKISNKLYLVLIGRKFFEAFLLILKLTFETTLLNNFQNCILNKKLKGYYRNLPWLNKDTRKVLKERTANSVLLENDQKLKSVKEILKKAEGCTQEILKAKINCILTMVSKLNHLKTTQ